VTARPHLDGAAAVDAADRADHADRAVNATGWRRCTYPLIPDDEIGTVEVPGAVLSRPDSGAIYWDVPRPRSYVRGAVYDSASRLVERSQRLGGHRGDLVLTVNPRHLPASEVRQAAQGGLTGRWLYAGHWMHGFGHFLIETLPTLWPLLTPGQAPVDGVVAHRFTSSAVHRWQRELADLLLAGRPVEVVTDGPRAVERLVVADRPYRYQVSISARAATVWEAVAERAGGRSAAGGDPVFLSRSRFQQDPGRARITGDRHLDNAADLDRVFAARGFRVVFPETLPVLEQVRLARDAPVLAGVSGSALHLSAFQRDGRVVEIGDPRSRSTMLETQRAIAAVTQRPAAHIPYREAGEHRLDRDHVLDLDHVAACLDRLGLS
jgi:hypothetical protein